jgi:hypothetical protein
VSGLVQVSKNSATEKAPGYSILQNKHVTMGATPCDFASKNSGGIGKPSDSTTYISGPHMKNIIAGCNTNKTLTTMQIILYPAGAVIAGVGLYLLITAPSSAKPAATASRWSFDPLVGPSGGKLDVTYHF